MKKGILTIGLIFIFFIVQSCIMPQFKIAGITPNLLMILIVSVAFLEGRLYGMLTGFGAGLFVDLFYSDILGFYALVYMICGYFVGYCTKKIRTFDYKLPMLLMTAALVVSNGATYLCLFVMRGRFDFGYYLGRIIMPEIVYTLVVSIVVYGVLYKIYASLQTAERRRDGYFV